MKIKLKSLISIFILAIVSVTPAMGVENKKAILTFGEVFPKTEEAKKKTLPVVEYVVARLNQAEIVKADALITDNVQAMIDHIKAQQVDVFVDTLHPLVYMKNQGLELKPLLYRLKKGVKQAAGVFIALKDNESINSLDDLVGKKLVFKTIHATQAHLVPRAYLMKNGFQLNYSQKHNHAAINCSFATDYYDIEDLVINGDVDAGTTSSHRLDLLIPEESEKLKIIAQTPLYPFHMVSVAPHVPSKTVQKIKNILLDMSDDPEARGILARYYRTNGFEAIPDEVTKLIQELAGFCDKELHQNDGQSVSDDRKSTLVIGKVTQNPRKHHPRLKYIADYAVSQMKDLGITQADVLFAKNNQEMVDYLNQGKIDWITETLYSALMFCQEAEAEILARRWKGGVRDYHTVIFTRNDSTINSIKDLKGKKITFEDPGSTSSYFVPISELTKNGFELIELKGPRSKSPEKKVGYVYSGSDLNTTTWVYKGLTDAGAISNLNWENPEDCPHAFKKNLKIIHRSKPYPRALELIRKNITPEIKQRLKEVLLNARNDPRAKDALRAYDKTTDFDEVSQHTHNLLVETKVTIGQIH